MEKETEPERPDFVWLNINDFGEDAFHVKSAVILDMSEGSRLLT